MGGRPRIYDHDAVLDRWARGETGPAIALALGLRDRFVVMSIVRRAAKYGDPRAVRRCQGYATGREIVGVSLTGKTYVALAEAAETRRTTAGKLAARLISTVIDDHLIDVVIDDRREAA